MPTDCEFIFSTALHIPLFSLEQNRAPLYYTSHSTMAAFGRNNALTMATNLMKTLTGSSRNLSGIVSSEVSTSHTQKWMQVSEIGTLPLVCSHISTCDTSSSREAVTQSRILIMVYGC
ncbi:uncharacterized protein LOC125205842 isoform X2 [Salvia hispanica]|uniref:uncharacterized protein LOC125205842 isoform X2 n=1 Tax=Salvia hispanica TaxID=49212 RepID=UPI002009B1FA|nr:uncharacterized protein LOC125205842 isoform X2 [Salvia hispanica]